MNVDRILALKLVGDVSSINKGLKGTQGRLRSTAGAAGSWMKAAGIGLAIEGVGKLGDVLGEAWGGFREGEKAAGRLGTTWRNLGVEGADLETTLGEIGDMALQLGTDDVAAIDAFNSALMTTGGKPKQAMDRLRIAQDLVANGSAPNLKAALKLIQGAANGSAKVVDQFGLKSETAGGRIRELGRKVKGAAKSAADLDPMRVMFNGIGEGLETVVGALSKGDIEGALGGIRDIGTAISEGWSDVFPAVDKAMGRLLGPEWEQVKTLAQGALDGISESVASLGRIWDGLAPHVENAVAIVSPLIEGLGTIVGLMAENVMLVLDAIGDLLNGDFTGAWEAAKGVVDNVAAAVQAAVGAVATFLGGILPGIQDTAAAIGDGIWSGIVGGIEGLAGRVKEIIDDGVGFIRGAWNSLDFRIPGFQLPAIDIGFPSTGNGDLDRLLPRIKGGPWQIFNGTGDLIPDLATGGIAHARPGGTLVRVAEAGRDEAIVPLPHGAGALGGGGDTYVFNIHLPVGGNPAEAGRQIVDLIKAHERRSGKGWRS